MAQLRDTDLFPRTSVRSEEVMPGPEILIRTLLGRNERPRGRLAGCLRLGLWSYVCVSACFLLKP